MAIEPAARIEEALARAAVYDLFANAFAYPDEDRVQVLRKAASEVLQGGGSIPLMRIAALAREADAAVLEPVFVALTTFSSSPDSPAFESAYFGADAQRQTQRMADIVGFYRAFGVDATESGFRPDELSVELEFLGFLCRKEAHAIEHLGAPRVGQARRAQKLFLNDHLGRWAIGFAANFAAAAPVGHFYMLAGETLALWLQRECGRVGADPESVSGDGLEAWLAPISHGPEFAGAASFVPADQLTVGV